MTWTQERAKIDGKYKQRSMRTKNEYPGLHEMRAGRPMANHIERWHEPWPMLDIKPSAIEAFGDVVKAFDESPLSSAPSDAPESDELED